MPRKDLIDHLHLQLEGEVSKRRINDLVEAVFDHIGCTLGEEGRFCQTGFGTFTVHVRNARPGRHPRTGEPIDLPESKTVRFKPAPNLLAHLDRAT